MRARGRRDHRHRRGRSNRRSGATSSPRPGRCARFRTASTSPRSTPLAGAAGRRRRSRSVTASAPDETVLRQRRPARGEQGLRRAGRRAGARVAAGPGALGVTRWRWVLVGAGPVSGARSKRRSQAQRARRSHVLFAGRASDADLHAWYGSGHGLRPSDALRGQLARHARSDGAPTRGDRHAAPAACPTRSGPARTAGSSSRATPPRSPRRSKTPLADRARLTAMGEKSRAIVEREFAWSVLVDQQIALYEQLLQRRPMAQSPNNPIAR